MHEEQRSYRFSRIKGAIAAVLVSVLGVAMFILLAIIWGKR